MLAVNSAGSSTSNTTNTATPAAPPAAPSNVVATAVSSSQINLTWTDNSANETGFTIERATAGTGPWTTLTTTTVNVVSYSSTGLVSGTTYYYRIKAESAVGASGYSSTASATTQGTAPAAPTALAAAAASSSQINLTWTDNSTNETGFAIERAASSSGPWSAVTTTAANASSYQDAGLASATAYYYRVKAVNGVGGSAYSNTASATTLSGTPAAPTGLVGTAPNSYQVNLSWVDNATNETGFTVEWSLGSAGPSERSPRSGPTRRPTRPAA